MKPCLRQRNLVLLVYMNVLLINGGKMGLSKTCVLHATCVFLTVSQNNLFSLTL